MVHNLDDAKIMEGLAAVEEGDLGKIGGDNEMDVREDNKDIDKQEVKAKKAIHQSCLAKCCTSYNC